MKILLTNSSTVLKTKYNFGFYLRLVSSLAFLVLFGHHPLFAQVANDGVLYVHDNAQLHIATGDYHFGVAPASTGTTRTNGTHGVVSFAANVTTSGASDSHYLNGYARTYGTQLFIAPVGQDGTYAPAGVKPLAGTGVDVAYTHANPSVIGSALPASVSAISSSEYWSIEGSTSAAIILSWRSSSNLSLLTSSLSDLVILGYNGTEWEVIPSSYQETSILGSPSTLASGSIASTVGVNLAGYHAFTLGAKSCSSSVVSSGNVKTWNGSWSPSAPGIADPVVINAPFTGSFSAYSVQMNADVTLTNSDYLDVTDAFTGTGKVIMASEASLVQHNSTAAAPVIVMTKVTNPMRRYDYVFLSSPINNTTTFFGHLRNKNNVAVNGQFGSQTYSAFQFFRTYNDAGTVAVDATPANTPVARGFSAAVLNQQPYNSSTALGAWYTEKYPIHIKTEGTTNNGDYPITVPVNGWARIGNPYPSAIDGEQLLNAVGSNVRKTIYYWTFNTPRQTLQGLSTDYNQADFAYWNYSGGTAACQGCEAPTGIIATMQSVMVKTLNAATAPVTFNLNNCMRVTSGNDNFFRHSANNNNRYWLNLNGSADSFSQVLIAYNENATYNYDEGYDSPRLASNNESAMSSLIGTTKCAIQTRPAFDDNDAVPLNVEKNLDEVFSISLHDKQGIFNTGNIKIYLHDKDLNVYHDLRTGSYNFIQSETSNNTRFEVVYKAETLDNPDFNSIKTIAVLNHQVFSVQSSEPMGRIEIYDLTGRLVETFNANNTTTLIQPFHHAQSVYIAKIQLTNGMIVTAKLINQ